MARGTGRVGTPPPGYEDAVRGAAFMERSYRGRLRIHGRAPGQMLGGIVTNRLPDPPEAREEGLLGARVSYNALLTPKGRMVTDLRVLRLEGDEEAFLLELPRAGVEGTLQYFRKYLPPRFAEVEDLSAATAMLTVVGPETGELVAREVLGGRVSAARLEELEEDEALIAPHEGSSPAETLRVIRSGDVGFPAYDVVGPADRLAVLGDRLADAGAARLGDEGWRTLRIEAGRPAYGEELDEETIPVEAGLEARAIDHGKGCYTGQEVIVRIRDRGKVNRHLRGLLLGDRSPPEPGTELFIEGRSRPAGELRSVVWSPRFGQAAGLGYVRRELEPPGRARLGTGDGPEVEVRALSDEGWLLVKGDPGAG